MKHLWEIYEKQMHIKFAMQSWKFKKREFLLLFTILLFSEVSMPQSDYFQIINNETIKVFYDISADITIERYADFYRIAKFDPKTLLFNGEFEDYDIEGNKVFTGSFVNGKLDGYCKYYYKNGNIKESGQYKNGIRDSIWFFYYPGKQIEKIIDFKEGVPFVDCLYNSKGKQLIKNGTGVYNGLIYKNNGKRIKYKIKGSLLDGKLNGKWEIKGVSKEFFENGNFIKGFKAVPYTDHQEIFLKNILGYYCQEDLTLFQNNFFCKSCIDDVSWALYNINANLDYELYESFLNEYSEVIDSLTINFICQIIEFKVNEDGTVDSLITYQTDSRFDIDEILGLLRKFTWIPLQCKATSEGFVYMMITAIEGKAYLPEPEMITDDAEANFLAKQMKKNNLIMCK